MRTQMKDWETVKLRSSGQIIQFLLKYLNLFTFVPQFLHSKNEEKSYEFNLDILAEIRIPLFDKI